MNWRSSIKNGDTVHIRFAYTHVPSGKSMWVIAKMRLEDGKAMLFNLLADGNGFGSVDFQDFTTCEFDKFSEWFVLRILNGDEHYDWVVETGNTLEFELPHGYTCKATIHRNFEGDTKAEELYEIQREWHQAMREVCKKGA